MKLETEIKKEPEEQPEEDPLQGLGENYHYVVPKIEPGTLDCNETTRIKSETVEEEVEYKIEVNDDFNDKYSLKDESKPHELSGL